MTHIRTNVAVDALRISPKFSSKDWEKLSLTEPADWPHAAQILRDRLDGRFLRFADDCLRQPFSGFVVLAIDSLLAETVQQFRRGVVDGHGKSEKLIKEFLAGARFQPDFDPVARRRFYLDIRCGLLHQAEAKEKWLIRRRQPALLQAVKGAHGYILDIQRFHQAMHQSLDDYCEELLHPEAAVLRKNLWSKMNVVCAVRAVRGATYEPDPLGLDGDPMLNT